MAESLPALIARRQKERGASSLRALYSLAELGDGGISYETLRRLSNGEQRGSRDPRVPRDLAVILGVSERIVREALAMEPDYGMWELPPRAQGLDARERDTVERVIDAILEAKRRGGTNDTSSAAPEKIRDGRSAGASHDIGNAIPALQNGSPDTGAQQSNVTAADFGAPPGSDLRPAQDPRRTVSGERPMAANEGNAAKDRPNGLGRDMGER